jgi:hypothetical protein
LDTFEAATQSILMRSDSFFHRWIGHAMYMYGARCEKGNGMGQLSPVIIPSRIDAWSQNRPGRHRQPFRCITMISYSPVCVDSGSVVVFLYLLLVLSSHPSPGTAQKCGMLPFPTAHHASVPTDSTLAAPSRGVTVVHVSRWCWASMERFGAGLRVSMPAQP